MAQQLTNMTPVQLRAFEDQQKAAAREHLSGLVEGCGRVLAERGEDAALTLLTDHFIKFEPYGAIALLSFSLVQQAKERLGSAVPQWKEAIE